MVAFSPSSISTIFLHKTIWGYTPLTEPQSELNFVHYNSEIRHSMKAISATFIWTCWQNVLHKKIIM